MSWDTQYSVIVLDRSELEKFLSVEEVSQLSGTDMQDIATAMLEKINKINIWEHAAFIAFKIVHREECNTIREFLRNALPQGMDLNEVHDYLRARYGMTFAEFAEEFIEDVKDLLTYEASNDLPEELKNS